MIDTLTIDHHIQKHILGVLMYQKYARFRDMRPDNIDTNLYSYHLKQLLKQKLVTKTTEGYTLDTLGLSFVDRINATTKRVSMQPKVITMAVIQDGYGGILMYRKLRQPFIDAWTVPFGKVHDKDLSLLDSVQREIKEKVGDFAVAMQHAGDCYIRVRSHDQTVVSTLVHVFYGQSDDISPSDHFEWVSPRHLSTLTTAPAIKEIIARTFFHDPFFFEEFLIEI
jgi:8-oxo-dGTP pyrophosphatase MutT (NUDIX family)